MRLGPGRVAVAALLFLVFAGFIALGVWQVERLQWKLDLIARVDARVHAAPVAAPAPADWPKVTAANDEYRSVSVTGRYLDRDSAYVQAVTEVGTGFWLLTPMRRPDGSVVIVNRGFVSARPQQPVGTARADAEAAPVTVTGLLRMPEPGGGFLRSNDPAADRWYSRDVAAIAAARGLGPVAPFFVDAARSDTARSDTTGSDSATTEPIGGLTVVRFHNSHLVYAITWFVLAFGTLAAAWQVRRAWIARDREAPTSN